MYALSPAQVDAVSHVEESIVDAFVTKGIDYETISGRFFTPAILKTAVALQRFFNGKTFSEIEDEVAQIDSSFLTKLSFVRRPSDKEWKRRGLAHLHFAGKGAFSNDLEVMAAAVAHDSRAVNFMGDELRKTPVKVKNVVQDPLSRVEQAVIAALKQRVTYRSLLLLINNSPLLNKIYAVQAFCFGKTWDESVQRRALKGIVETSFLDNVCTMTPLSLETWKREGLAALFRDERFREDRHVVHAQLARDGLSLRDVGRELQDDQETVCLAVDQNKDAIQYASTRVQRLLEESRLPQTD